MKSINKFLLIILVFAFSFIIGCTGDEKQEYKVEFYFENSLYETQTVLSGDRLIKPIDPTLDDLIFDGWYVDGEKWMFTSGLVVSDMRLDAIFTDESGKVEEVIPGIEPVYQGMSIVSNEELNSETYKLNSSYKNRKNNKNFKDSIDDILGVITTEKVEYFASKGEKFNIVVHLYNPSKYEILSFTLNDYKYQSFEFKEGSNSEQLIIEVDAGLVSGLKEYTIDGIKYIDGTLIKDVKMDGEKTIKAGITYDLVPTGTVLNAEVSTTSYKLTIDVKDSNNLINASNGIHIFLFDGTNIVSQKALNLGINTIDFDNLLMGTEYTYMVVGVYDSYSGTGKRANELASDTFKTIDGYLLNTLEVKQDSIKMQLNKEDEISKFKSIGLYLDNKLISEKEYSEEVVFDNLLSNSNYEIVLKYTYTNNNTERENEISMEVHTASKVIPIISINSLLSDKKEISYKFEESDIDNTKKNINVSLYQGVYNTQTLNTLEGKFTSLYSNTEYKVVLSYEYDLNDGKGVQLITQEYELSTKESNTPKVDITYTYTIDSLTFKSNVTDVDNNLKDVTYKLYQGEVLVDSTTEKEYTFNNLKSNTEYKLVADYNYDLLDGQGIINKKDDYLLVLGKEVPEFSLTSYFISDSVIEYNLLISDPNASGRLNMLALYQGNNFVKRLDETTSKIDNLESNTDYVIKANYVYDFDDGKGSREINYEYKFKTLKKDPTIELGTNNITKNSIEFIYNINDIDDALELSKLELLSNGNVVKEFNSLNQTMFDGLLSDNLYTLKATFNKNLNSGIDTVIKTISIKTLALEKPTVDIELEATKTNVSYSYSINDPDKISTVKSVDIYYQGSKVEQSVTDNMFTGLYSNSEYEVVVTLLCDYKNGTDLKEEEYKQTIKTEAYGIPSVEIDLTSTVDTINYNFIENDANDLLKVNKINVYKGQALVKELTSLEDGKITELLSNTLYRVEVIYEYDLNDNNGKHTSTIERTYSTLAHDVHVIGYSVLNSGSPKTNEDINLNIELENISKVTLAYVLVNGVKYEISGGDRYHNIVVILKAPKESGTFNISVEKFGYILNGVEVEQTIDNVNTFNVQIMSRLDIISANTLEMSNVLSNNSYIGLMLTIDNPYNYTIEKFVINGSEYNAHMIDSNHIYISSYQVRNNSNVNITKVIYKDANGNTTSRNYNSYNDLKISILESSAFKVQLIHTPEELLNIKSGYAYELANDIDMSGYTWEPIDFNGYFDGKGYSIKNLNVIHENEYENSNCGIFSSLGGTFKNVYFDNLYMFIKTNNLNCNLLYGDNNNILIENVLFNGNVNIDCESDLNYSFQIPESNSLYIVESLMVNNKTYLYNNIITKETFESNEFKQNTLGWDYTSKKYGVYNGLQYNIYDNSYIFIVGVEEDCIDVNIPKTINNLPVVGISDLAFASSNINSLEINDNIMHIGSQFITNCDNLETIIIEGSDVINHEAYYYLFNGCILNNVKYLHITSKVKDLYFQLDRAYFNVETLETLYLDGLYCNLFDNDSLKEITLKNLTNTGQYYNSHNLEIVTLENVENLEMSIFASCENLTTVKLPNNLKSIGYGAFSSCNLNKIELPNSLNKIGEQAFWGCNNLESIVIPSSVTSIQNNAFSYCYAKLYCIVDSKPNGWSSKWMGDDYNNSIIWNFKSFYSDSSYDYVLFNDNTASIAKYNGSNNNVIIDNEINIDNDTYVITKIGDEAFKNSTVTSVKLPNNINEIGAYAFAGCTNLTTFDIHEGVTKINRDAFSGCESLVSIKLPNSLEEIGANAFRECTSLDVVDLPKSLKIIGNYAFYGCSSISYFVVPESVLEIKAYAFGNDGLKTIYCEGNNKKQDWNDNWSGSSNVYYGFVDFYKDSNFEYVLFNDNTCLIINYIGTLNDVIINSTVTYKNTQYTVTTINDRVFAGTSIVSVEMPDTIYKIGNEIFMHSSNLSSVKLSNSLTEIPYNAFYGCKSLYNINIPEGVSIIEDYSFCDCSNLHEVKLPSTLVEIQSNAFCNCHELQNVVLPKSLISVGTYAFGSCDNLNSIYIPISVVKIEYAAFSNGYPLIIYCEAESRPKNWDFEWTLHDNSTIYWGISSVYSDELFEYSLFNDFTASIKKYIGSETNIIVNSQITYDGNTYTVTNIGEEAFAKTNVKKVELPNTILSISDSAFYSCEDLTTVLLPDSLLSIGNYAFIYCNNLTNLTLPNSLTSIGADAFTCCHTLNTIIIPENVLTIGRWAFGNGANISIYCKAESKPKNWNNEWIYSDGATVYWGFIGEYKDSLFNYILFNDGSANITKYIGNQKEITIKPISYNGNTYNVTTINPYTFENTDIEKVVLPDTVTEIGNNIFEYCVNLKTVELSSSITKIPYNSFKNCLSLESIIIPEGVTIIESEAFFECMSLSVVQLPSTLLEIHYNAFWSCQNLSSIELPSSLEVIGSNAFGACYSLQSIYIPISVTKIEESAFSNGTTMTIYCDAESKPSGWNSNWAYLPNNPEIIWSYTN